MKRTVTLYGIKATVPDAPEFDFEGDAWCFYFTDREWVELQDKGYHAQIAIAADVAECWWTRKENEYGTKTMCGNDYSDEMCHAEAQADKWKAIAEAARKEAK